LSLGPWHTTHLIVRLSTVPKAFTMVYYLAIAERLQVNKVTRWRIGAFDV